MDSIYLASRSPRRRELLGLIGIEFAPIDLDLDETQRSGEPPAAYVERLAREKAQAGWKRAEGKPRPVLGADTTVTLEGCIFGKPAGRREASEMLTALSGRTHEVLTAIALRHPGGMASALSVSTVSFRQLGEKNIQDYLATGEWEGKAGAYAVQGAAARFVTDLRGSFSGVMGLPLCETARLLERIAHYTKP